MAQSESGEAVRESAPTPATEQILRLIEEHNTRVGSSTAVEQSDSGPLETLLDTALASIGADSSFEFDSQLVTRSLDEVLLALIAIRERDTNGNALIQDLDELFDSRVSPGTVYPTLHEMDDEDLLEMFELVQSKEYRIADSGQATDRIEAAAQQHLALGVFLHRAAQEV